MRLLETKIPAPIIAATAGASMKLYARCLGVSIDPSALRMHVGLTVAQASAVLVLAAVSALWRARTTINPLDPTKTTALVTRGIFRLSRNPMYLSLLLLLVAYAIRLDSLTVWLGPMTFFAYVTRFQIVPEERVLSAKFGPAFLQYKSRTRRWI